MSDLSRKFARKDGGEVEVRISCPVQSDGLNGDWQCTYRILGLGSSKARMAMGVDSIQAIYLALQYVSTALYSSEEFENGKLSWQGGMTPSDLGLPIVETAREDVERMKAHVEQLVSSGKQK